MKNNPSSLLVTTIASIILTACGGGGGSSKSTPSSQAASLPGSSSAISSSSSSVASSVTPLSSSVASTSSSLSVLASVSSNSSPISSSSSSSSSVFVNALPVFASATSVNVREGLRSTGYLAAATDGNNDVLAYSISGGDDRAQFTIDSATGALSFIAAPLFDEPTDSNKNNIYTIVISAQDSHGGTATQTVEITVTDAPRVLTDLSVENTGSLLTASVACDECQLSATTFEWILEGSDAPVATGDSYKLPVADQHKKITVKAIPVMENGASGQPEMAELTFNKAEKVVFGLGINAVLKTNGEVVVWGNGVDGTADYSEIIDDVDRIIESDVNDPVRSIAAIKKDGSLVTWGDPEYGGGISNHASAMHVKDAFKGIFIVSFNEDGSLSRFGSRMPARRNASVDFDDLKNIRQIIIGRDGDYGLDWPSNDLYAIDDNGNVTSYCWSPLHYCGDISTIDLTNVKEIVSGGSDAYGGVFAALGADGSLASFGAGRYGSNQKFFSDHGDVDDAIQLVASGSRSFAALRSNNEVITWGSSEAGGNPSGVDLTNVESLYSNYYGFAAKKHDGTVVIWRETGKVVADNVKTLVAINSNYVAIKMDGTVGFWDVDGNDRYEDLISYEYDDDYNVIGSAMPSLTAVREIIGGRYSFSALKEDGTVYSWGTGNDGDSGFTNIVKIFKPQGDTYAGLDVDGNLRIWGELDSVGDVPEDDVAPTLIELSSTLN